MREQARFVPIDQRKWNDIPAVDYVSRRSLSWRVLKIIAKMLRHQGSGREDDVAIDWNTLLPLLCRDYEYENAGRWTNKEWLDLLKQGSDKKRFQHCLNSDGLILFMRAIQGRWLFPLVVLHYPIRIGLQEEKFAKEGRQTVFLTALDPVGDEPEEEPQDLSKPRKERYKNKCSRMPKLDQSEKGSG